MLTDIALISAFVVVVFIAGLFAGAETGIYRLSPLRLRLGIETKRLRYVILGKAATDKPGLLLSMLVGTSLAHYLATSIVTVVLLNRLGAEHTAELFATVITAPVLLVFSELIPKSTFFHRADLLMPLLSPFLLVSHKVFTFTGVVPLLRSCSAVFARLTGTRAIGRTEIADARSPYITAILQETREEAFLSPVQMQIIFRTAAIVTTPVSSVMTGMNKVRTAEISCDRAALLNKLGHHPYARLPVYDQRPENIVGFINIYDCLGSSAEFTDLNDFIRPIAKLSGDVTVADAINVMQKQKQKIVLVTRGTRAGREKPLGIVTMKDLVEELLGELAEW
jgi:CBS domain containing-hemolysin-like protein